MLVNHRRYSLHYVGFVIPLPHHPLHHRLWSSMTRLMPPAWHSDTSEPGRIFSLFCVFAISLIRLLVVLSSG
eukprot:7623634-Pyramimonas_sp.AAC.1